MLLHDVTRRVFPRCCLRALFVSHSFDLFQLLLALFLFTDDLYYVVFPNILFMRSRDVWLSNSRERHFSQVKEGSQTYAKTSTRHTQATQTRQTQLKQHV